jgi:hypothetical protein
MYVEWRRLQLAGMRGAQESFVPLFERTRLFKSYCTAVIPGFFQTPGYAGALLNTISAFHGTPDDLDEAVGARMGRNRLVRSGNHRSLPCLKRPSCGRSLAMRRSWQGSSSY